MDYIQRLIDSSLGEYIAMGGKGSGHWRHRGRPGKVGGSAPRAISTRLSKRQLNSNLSKERLALIDKATSNLPQEHLDAVWEIREFPFGPGGANAKCDRSGGIVLNSDREQTEGTIIHEIVHAVQHASGFGYEDRPDHMHNFWALYREKVGHLVSLVDGEYEHWEEKVSEARIRYKGFPTAYSQRSYEELFAESYM